MCALGAGRIAPARLPESAGRPSKFPGSPESAPTTVPGVTPLPLQDGSLPSAGPPPRPETFW